MRNVFDVEWNYASYNLETLQKYSLAKKNFLDVWKKLVGKMKANENLRFPLLTTFNIKTFRQAWFELVILINATLIKKKLMEFEKNFNVITR